MQLYLLSLASMKDWKSIMTKDGGARVVEALLDSNTSGKIKHRLIVELQGRFGELVMHSSGSFTVEKCVVAINASLGEVIAPDLLAVQVELLKTKQGPYLLSRLDIDRYTNHPDQ